MRPCLEVGICGDSLFIQGMKETLRRCQGFRVSHLGNSLEKAEREIPMLFPAVLLFELAKVQEQSIVNLLANYPQMQLVGLQADTDRVTLFSVEREQGDGGLFTEGDSHYRKELAVHSLEEMVRLLLTVENKLAGQSM